MNRITLIANTLRISLLSLVMIGLATAPFAPTASADTWKPNSTDDGILQISAEENYGNAYFTLPNVDSSIFYIQINPHYAAAHNVTSMPVHYTIVQFYCGDVLNSSCNLRQNTVSGTAVAYSKYRNSVKHAFVMTAGETVQLGKQTTNCGFFQTDLTLSGYPGANSQHAYQSATWHNTGVKCTQPAPAAKALVTPIAKPKNQDKVS